MIITRAPLRMSFVGGGSDLPAFYEQFGGAVVSTAIDKYIYVTINKKFDDKIRISYSKTEIVGSVSEIQHNLVRACLDFTGIDGGLEITTIADIPSKGTGLGSSSAFTVALLHGLYAFRGEYASAERLAEEACHIEINVCGAMIGKQDQYASAYGGFNFIRFHKNGFVDIDPIICPPELKYKLQSHIIMFYTGKTRSASELLKKQSSEVSNQLSVQSSLLNMVTLAENMRDMLQSGEINCIGDMLHQNWVLKRGLTEGISNSSIDGWYDKGCRAGAIGGKILGAGAGGFLTFFAPPQKHAAIQHALPELRRIPVAFERSGSSVIFYHG